VLCFAGKLMMMMMNDVERQNMGFYGFFGDFGL